MTTALPSCNTNNLFVSLVGCSCVIIINKIKNGRNDEQILLFLDESECIANPSSAFCIAGIIIEENNLRNNIELHIKKIKGLLWGELPNYENLILHEKEIRDANTARVPLKNIKPEYQRFRQNKYMRILFTELDNMFQNNPLIVIGACLNIDELNKYFNIDILSDKYLIGMQILFENFCHFLAANNGRGYVLCESRGENYDKEI